MISFYIISYDMFSEQYDIVKQETTRLIVKNGTWQQLVII